MNHADARDLVHRLLIEDLNSVDPDLTPADIDEWIDVDALVPRLFDYDEVDGYQLRSDVDHDTVRLRAHQHPRMGSPGPSTDLPCPRWCEYPQPHRLDVIADDSDGTDSGAVISQRYARTHVRRLGSKTSHVTLEVRERMLTPSGPTDLGADSEALLIGVHLAPTRYLTGPGARRLAGLLIAAAEHWDNEHDTPSFNISE